jgi:hypothetical protein
MKTNADIRICILGGRSFGKTSLLSSLILISGSKDAGITVSGRNQKKIAAINDYKNSNNMLEATSWEDICEYKYKITDKTNGQARRWHVTFVDYPGEFFQKFIEDDTLVGSFKRIIKSDASESKDSSRAFTKEEEKQARKLKKALERADALVVLLPADINNKAYSNDLSTFKANLQLILENVQKRNPYIPVCLAINKWDMLGFSYEQSNLDSVLRQEPYSEFNDMMSLVCSDDYYFCQAVSAFGKNKASDSDVKDDNEKLLQEWDGEAKPCNVLEMLIRLSDLAEKARYRLMSEQYQQSSLLVKTFISPFTFLGAFLHGATSADNRSFCRSTLAKTTSLFFGAILCIIAIIYCSLAITISMADYRHISGISNNVAYLLGKLTPECDTNEPGYNTTPEELKQIKDSMIGYPHKLAYFCSNKAEKTNKLIYNLEDAYNRRILEQARAYCNLPQNMDYDARQMLSGERLDRIKVRLEKWEQALNSLTQQNTVVTEESREVRDIINEKIRLEKELCSKIQNEKDLDDSLHELEQKAENEKCRYIEDIIDKFETRFPNREDDFVILHQQLSSLQDGYEKVLASDLDKLSDQPESIDCDERIRLAKRRVSRIQEESSHLPKRAKFGVQHENMIASNNLLIQYLEHDKQFYEQYKELRTKDSTGKIRLIDSFLETFNKDDYSRCEKYIKELENERLRLIQSVTERKNNILKANPIDEDLPAKDKITRLTRCLSAWEEAFKEYSISSVEYTEAEQMIQKIKGRLEQEDSNAKFEAAFSIVKESEDSGKIKRIVAFLSEYTKQVYAHKQESYDELDKEIERLKKKWAKQLEEAQKKWKDNPELSAKLRLDNINSLIAEYEIIKKEYPESWNEFETIKTLIVATNENSKRLGIYLSFDKDYAAIEYLKENRKAKSIDAFLITYGRNPEITEQKYKTIIENLKAQYSHLLDTCKKELAREIEEIIKESDNKTWESKVNAHRKCIAIINQAKEKFPERECFYFENLEKEHNVCISSITHYGKLGDEVARLSYENKFQQYNAASQFFQKYKEEDYPEGRASFDLARQILSDSIVQINATFNQNISGLGETPTVEFARGVQYYAKCMEYADDCIRQIEQGLELSSSFEDKYKEYEKQKQKYARFVEIERHGKTLTCDDGQADRKTAEQRLEGIKSFKEQYPQKDNSEDELTSLYKEIDDIQRGVENIITRYLDQELTAIVHRLPPAASEEQKMANITEQLDLLNKYTAIMPRDSNLYRQYNGKTVALQNKLDVVKLTERFQRDSKDLQSIINSEVPADEKMTKIDEFVSKYNSYEQFAERVKQFENDRDVLKHEVDWGRYEITVDNVLKDRPVGNNLNIQDYIRHRQNVEERLNELTQFKQLPYINNRASNKEAELRERLVWIKKQIGDGTLADIQDKEKKYKKNPCDTTYASFSSAIKNFNETEFPEHKDAVEEIKENLEEDRRTMSSVANALRLFKYEPSKDRFQNFDDAVSEAVKQSNKYGIVHPELKSYSNYISKVKSGLSLIVSLESVRFGDKWDDLKLSISYTNKLDQPVTYPFSMTIVSGSITNNQTVYPGDNLRWTSNEQLPRQFSIPFDSSFIVTSTFNNWKDYTPINDFIGYWGIIGMGLSGNQSFSYSFTGNSEGSSGGVILKIRGVPTL